MKKRWLVAVGAALVLAASLFLALRPQNPMRIAKLLQTDYPEAVCVIGETDFVMNGMLASRASANRDFFVNAVAWLAGIDMGSAPSLGGDATLVTGFTRREWILFMAGAAGVVPLCAFLAFCLASRRTRR